MSIVGPSNGPSRFSVLGGITGVGNTSSKVASRVAPEKPVPAGPMQPRFHRGVKGNAMKDQEPNVARITVAEAFRRVREAIESNDDYRRFPDHKVLYASVSMHDANEAWVEREPTKTQVQRTSGKEIAISVLKESFLAFCGAAGVAPRSLHNPWASAPYTGDGYEDFTYDIALNEYEEWAAPYLQATIPWSSSGAAKQGEPSASQAIPRAAISPADAAATQVQSISDLFDPVTVEALEKMFPANKRWNTWAGRAKRNGLIAARESRAVFNPYKAAMWFLGQGEANWDLARCNRVLANNLPARSQHEAHILVSEHG
jgi:hypothetical protein